MNSLCLILICLSFLVSLQAFGCPTAYSKLQCQECCPDDYLKESTW